MLESITLGVIQGLCEFLPVSSSGHLALLQYFFGLGNENLVAFDLLLHFATVLASLIYFRREIIQVIIEWFGGWFGKRTFGWEYGWAILIATFLTGIIGLPLRDVVEIMSSSPLYVGGGLIFTAIVLGCVPIMSRSDKNHSLLKIAVVVGIAQGFAVLPGVSRSGMTIAACLFMGLEVNEAFRFSFLISIPAIFGANLLEALKFLKTGEAAFLPEGYVWACVAAFVLGLAALGIMRKLVTNEKWPYFGIYCFVLGALMIVLSLQLF